MINDNPNPTKKPVSALRQRMIEDMTMRQLSPKTQTGYIRAVKKLTDFLGPLCQDSCRLFEYYHEGRKGHLYETLFARIERIHHS
jgi:hypothetical protein